MYDKNVFEADYFRVTARVWRRRSLLTIAEMAELSGLSPQRLGAIETGGVCPTIAELSHLCDVMDERVATFWKMPKKGEI